MTGSVRLDVDGAIATITNDNPDKHNAFDDEMDLQLFTIFDQLASMPEIPTRHAQSSGVCCRLSITWSRIWSIFMRLRVSIFANSASFA